MCLLHWMVRSEVVIIDWTRWGLPLDSLHIIIRVLYYTWTSAHLSILLQHDVVRMSIPNPQYIGGHAAASTGADEVVNGSLPRCPVRVLVHQPLVEQLLVEGPHRSSSFLLDLGYCGWVEDDLNHTNLVPSRQTAIWVHPEILNACGLDNVLQYIPKTVAASSSTRGAQSFGPWISLTRFVQKMWYYLLTSDNIGYFLSIKILCKAVHEHSKCWFQTEK